MSLINQQKKTTEDWFFQLFAFALVLGVVVTIFLY
jgi:hypothetical protein